MISLMLNIGERDVADGYRECLACGSKTMLVSALSYWIVDQEAFKADERTDHDPDIPGEVEVSAEITGHWCDNCDKLTAICVHQN